MGEPRHATAELKRPPSSREGGVADEALRCAPRCASRCASAAASRAHLLQPSPSFCAHFFPLERSLSHEQGRVLAPIVTFFT